MRDRASDLRAIADGRLMLNVRNGVTVARSMLAMIADEFETMSTALAAKDAELAVENAELRRIVGECAAALGNGAYISTEGTIAFMALLPKEIRLRVEAWRTRAERAEARLAEANKALGMMLKEHDILSGNFGDVMDPKHKRPDRWPTAAEAARRALEGGNND